MTGTTAIRYRKTRQGDWVAYGPASLVKANDEVVITKANGTEDCRYVERTGKPFQVDGTAMVYGYLEPQARRTRRVYSGATCDECGRYAHTLTDCLDSSGLGGRCCPRCAAQPAYTRSFA